MLQVMIHLFFKTISTAPRKLKQDLSRPPPWLKDTCSPPSAQLFARILTIWASPPTTNWQPTQDNKRRLISVAAKTGKAVSKHIPWFMMEYIALQAEYPDLVMEDSVRQALLPGIYALFGVLGTYEREMCMAALDGPSRGIFKSLWEDWSKHGRFVER
jgi:nucleolar pre-ribosomal-associated protein 2